HFHAPVGVVGPVDFLNPIILPQQPITLSVTASWVDSHRIRYVFKETDAKERSSSGQPCAVVEIECDTKEQHIGGTRWPLVKTVQQQPEFAADAKVFYQRLRENGNEYGPHFQTLKHV